MICCTSRCCSAVVNMCRPRISMFVATRLLFHGFSEFGGPKYSGAGTHALVRTATSPRATHQSWTSAALRTSPTEPARHSRSPTPAARQHQHRIASPTSRARCLQHSVGAVRKRHVRPDLSRNRQRNAVVGAGGARRVHREPAQQHDTASTARRWRMARTCCSPNTRMDSSHLPSRSLWRTQADIGKADCCHRPTSGTPRTANTRFSHNTTGAAARPRAHREAVFAHKRKRRRIRNQHAAQNRRRRSHQQLRHCETNNNLHRPHTSTSTPPTCDCDVVAT
jgi:hypothetical protein